MIEIGKKIKALRVQQGWTQEVLAIKLGLTRFAVANWELGRRTPPTDCLNRIAEVFNVGVDYLLESRSYKDSVAEFLARAESIFTSEDTDWEDCEVMFESVMKLYILKKSTIHTKEKHNTH